MGRVSVEQYYDDIETATHKTMERGGVAEIETLDLRRSRGDGGIPIVAVVADDARGIREDGRRDDDVVVPRGDDAIATGGGR